MKDNIQRMETQLGIVGDMGYKLNDKSVILDLGCGNGNLVNEYRKNGYQAYGCDFEFKDGAAVAQLEANGIIRKIGNVYKLPFDDNSIDFVISDQVFEHVKDYPGTLFEIKRVLKSGGISLHFFPSRYRVIEPHVHVPFASVIQKHYWLKLWAYLGVRTNKQKGFTAKKIADDNYNYLTNHTSYLTRAAIKRHCNNYFRKVAFCENIFFKYIQRAPVLFQLLRTFPFLPKIYSTIRTRVLFFSK